MYTHVNPSFTLYMGFKGVQIEDFRRTAVKQVPNINHLNLKQNLWAV